MMAFRRYLDPRGGNHTWYTRLLRLRHLRLTGIRGLLLGEGTVLAAVLLAFAEIAPWWGAPVLPLAVAGMVKWNDQLAGALPVARPDPQRPDQLRSVPRHPGPQRPGPVAGRGGAPAPRRGRGAEQGAVPGRGALVGAAAHAAAGADLVPEPVDPTGEVPAPATGPARRRGRRYRSGVAIAAAPDTTHRPASDPSPAAHRAGRHAATTGIRPDGDPSAVGSHAEPKRETGGVVGQHVPDAGERVPDAEQATYAAWRARQSAAHHYD